MVCASAQAGFGKLLLVVCDAALFEQCALSVSFFVKRSLCRLVFFQK